MSLSGHGKTLFSCSLSFQMAFWLTYWGIFYDAINLPSMYSLFIDFKTFILLFPSPMPWMLSVIVLALWLFTRAQNVRQIKVTKYLFLSFAICIICLVNFWSMGLSEHHIKGRINMRVRKILACNVNRFLHYLNDKLCNTYWMLSLSIESNIFFYFHEKRRIK